MGVWACAVPTTVNAQANAAAALITWRLFIKAPKRQSDVKNRM